MSQSPKNKKVLLFGASGSFGCALAECLSQLAVDLTAFVRADTRLGKKDRLDRLNSCNIHLVEGDFSSVDQLQKLMSGVNIVISCLSGAALKLQLDLIEIAKKAGVKRFVPSEYGSCPEMAEHDPCMEGSVFGTKLAVREKLLASGLAWTIVADFTFMHYFFPRLGELSSEMQRPPRSVQLYAGGRHKASFVTLQDAAALTATAALDERSINKIVHIRPNGHHLSQSELMSLWTSISGQSVEQTPVPSLVDSIHGSSGVQRAILQFTYYLWEKGAQAQAIPQNDLEATSLYSDILLQSPADYFKALLGQPAA